MQITSIETIHVGAYANITCVEGHTDEGLIGLGETFRTPRAVAAQIHETVAPYLLGKDPLAIDAAVIAIALLGNTLSQVARAHPSTGGFITFVGKTFGGTSAVTTALLVGAGYIIAISSVLGLAGG